MGGETEWVGNGGTPCRIITRQVCRNGLRLLWVGPGLYDILRGMSDHHLGRALQTMERLLLSPRHDESTNLLAEWVAALRRETRLRAERAVA